MVSILSVTPRAGDTNGKLATLVSEGHVIGVIERTWHNVTRIHRVLILDEAETVHQLHLCDVSGAMLCEMRLDIGLGSCRQRVSGCERERQN